MIFTKSNNSDIIALIKGGMNMITLQIEQILEFNSYLLKDSNNNQYELVLEFYGIDNPKVSDRILIHEALLDVGSETYTQPYAFELTSEVSAEEIKEMNNAEFIIVGDNNIFNTLKRIYG